MRITIDRIDMRPRRCTVHTRAGHAIVCVREKVDRFGLKAGSSYEVRTETIKIGRRTMPAIVTARKVTNARSRADIAALLTTCPPPARPLPATPAGNDTANEQRFVQAILEALIRTGEVRKADLWATTQLLRGLWRHSFGGVPYHAEAAE
jgi:hypothetical protein